MTVSTTINRKEYDGNGATVAFAYPYPFLANADLVVLYVDANGVSATWVLDTHYTVTGAGTESSGQVTVKTSPTDYTPATGTQIIIYRDPALTQSTDFVNNSALDAEVLEQALDRQTMVSQRTRELTERSMRLADSDTSGASVVLPLPTASKLLGWNSAANALENFTPNSDTYLSVSAFALTLLEAPTAAAAQETLGLEIGVDAQAYDADTLFADTSDNLTVGFTTDEYAHGTISTGTVTVSLTVESIQTLTNNGAFTLAPPASGAGHAEIWITNDASAGAITTSGFTVVTGDTYATTNAKKYLFQIARSSVGSILNVVEVA